MPRLAHEHHREAGPGATSAYEWRARCRPGLSAAPRRDADRDRVWMDLDAQVLSSRARPPIKFEAHFLLEADRELPPLRDRRERRLLGMPQGELAERPCPLDRIP